MHALAGRGELVERIEAASTWLLGMEDEFDARSRKIEEEWRRVMERVWPEGESIGDHLWRLNQSELVTAAESIVDLCRLIDQEWGRLIGP